MKHNVILAFALLFWFSAAFAADPALDTEQKRFSYTVGFQMAQGLHQQGIDVNPDALILAIRDVLAGAPLKLTLDEMQAVSRAYIEREAQEKKAVADKNKQAGEAYLADNGEKEGVIPT